MLVPPRFLLVVSLVAALGLSACGKSKPRAQPNRAELERSAAQAKQSLAGLEKPLGMVNDAYRALHHEFDPLPPGLPGYGDTRAKFYAVDNAIGTMNAKLPWLAGRIDAAVKAGDSAGLKAISEDIVSTRDQVKQAEQIAVELREQVKPFHALAVQKADELELRGKLTCD